MRRNFILSASFVALVSGAAFAQQQPVYPNPTEIVPTPESPPKTPHVPPVIPVTPASAAAARSAVSVSGDVMSATIQGLAVYTVRPDMKVAAPTTTRTVTNDEFKAMKDGYQSIGKIDNLVVSVDGQVKNAVVSVGGFLGVGERNVALLWNDLRLVRSIDGDMFAFVDKGKADLEKLPEFKLAQK